MRPPIIILGMHRSGTSCLAGSLQEAGVFLGDVVVSAPHNEKGNRELKSLRILHERVLNESGGSWRRPPSSVHWSDECKEIQRSLVDQIGGDYSWGFKDPRTLLVYQRWIDEFPDARFAGTFRHPDAVAASLCRRDKMSYEAAIDLWMKYNRLLLSISSEWGFRLIEFDADIDCYSYALGILAAELELTPPAVFEFPTVQLVHNSPKQSASLPIDVLDLYNELISKTL